MMPAAMGTGHRINKRTSNVNLLLAEKVIQAKPTKKTVVKTEKKVLKDKKPTSVKATAGK